MAFIICERCGKKYSDKADTCPFCRASKQPVELGKIDSPQFEFSPQDQDRPSPFPDCHDRIMLDCKACDNIKSMVQTKIPRFNGVIRAIGTIFLIPSLLGIGISIIGLFSTCTVHHDVMLASGNSDPYLATGAALGSAISGGLFLVMGVGAFVGGLLGWLLLLTRKVYRCTVCGHVIDRA